MVDGSDDAHELTAERPSDYGHAGLKAAKEQAGHHGNFKVDLLHAKALADGNGKGVHRKANGEQHELCESHSLAPSLRAGPRVPFGGVTKRPVAYALRAQPRVSFIKASQAASASMLTCRATGGETGHATTPSFMRIPMLPHKQLIWIGALSCVRSFCKHRILRASQGQTVRNLLTFMERIRWERCLG